jgi:hypothetical protein
VKNVFIIVLASINLHVSILTLSILSSLQKLKILRRANSQFSFTTYWVFDTTRTAQKTPRPTVLFFLCIRYSGDVFTKLLSSNDRGGGTQIHRQHGDLTSFLSFFQNKESRPRQGMSGRINKHHFPAAQTRNLTELAFVVLGNANVWTNNEIRFDSSVLNSFVVGRSLILYTVSRTLSTGDQPVARPLHTLQFTTARMKSSQSAVSLPTVAW